MTTLSDPEPWSEVAAGYTRWTHHQLSRYAEDAARLLSPGPASAVLDVGCGTGAATLALARAAGHVTAVDFAPGMLATLRETLERTETRNVTVVHGDGQDLALPDAAFDIAISMFALMFFPDRAAGLAELRRCLRPGGQVAVSCWPPMMDSPAIRWMVGGFAAAFPDLPPPVRSDLALDSASKLRAELARAGFVDVEIHHLSHEVVVDDVARFWNAMFAGSAPARLIRPHFSAAEWARRQTVAIDHLRGHTAIPFAAPMPGFLGIGRKAGA